MMNLKKITLVLGLLLLIGGGYAVRASIPTQFWRVVQKGSDMFFQYGDLDNPVDKVVFTSDGRMGVDTTGNGTPNPESSALLELKAVNKAVLVTRVANASSIATPESGMIAYFNDTDCFKVYQGARWSSCFNVADGIANSVGGTGTLGDIGFNPVSDKIMIHNGNEWVEIGQSLVGVGTATPSDGDEGEIFYNTTENQFLIFTGDQWVSLDVDPSEFSSLKTDCEVVAYSSTVGKELTCPNNKFASRLVFESGVWGSGNDNLSQPEIEGLECCRLTYETPAP